MIKIKVHRKGKITITAPKVKHKDIISRLQRSTVHQCISNCLVSFTDTKVINVKK